MLLHGDFLLITDPPVRSSYTEHHSMVNITYSLNSISIESDPANCMLHFFSTSQSNPSRRTAATAQTILMYTMLKHHVKNSRVDIGFVEVSIIVTFLLHFDVVIKSESIKW